MGVRHENTWLERIAHDRDRWEAICPHCHRELGNVGAERGWCEEHGSVFVDFGHPVSEDEHDRT